MIYSAIDIGTNAVRLFVGNVLDRNSKPYVHKLSLTRVPIRLGDDVFQSSYISEEKERKLLKAIEAFKLINEIYQPVSVEVFATSAMREAKNGSDIVQKIHDVCNYPVKIIDGKEEARILFELFKDAGKKHETLLLIDLGGGSTEITIVHPNNEVHSKSFEIGTVRMINNKISDKEWEKLTKFIDKNLQSRQVYAIGSGGNINSLKNHFGDPLDKFLNFNRLRLAYDALSSLSTEDRINRYLLRPDRADVIVPASEIFIKIMEIAGIDRISVPRAGLTEGMILMMHKNISL